MPARRLVRVDGDHAARLVLLTHLPPNRAAFWFLMQVGILIGLATTYPLNLWLIRDGIKDMMWSLAGCPVPEMRRAGRGGGNNASRCGAARRAVSRGPGPGAASGW